MAFRFRLPSPASLLVMAISAPACLGAVIYGSEVGHQVAILEQEAESAHLSSAVLETLIEAHVGRGTEALAIMNRTIGTQLDAGRAPAVTSGIQAARQALAEGDQDRAVAGLVDLVKTIGETGGLVLDTDAGRYAIMDTFIQQLPDLIALDSARQKLGDLERPGRSPSPEIQARLLALEELITRTKESIQRDVRDAFRMAPTQASLLAAPALELEQALGDRTRFREGMQAYREAAIATFLKMADHRIRAWQLHALSMLSGLVLLLAIAMAVALRILKGLTSADGVIHTVIADPETPGSARMEPLATGSATRERGYPLPAGSARWSPEGEQEAV